MASLMRWLGPSGIVHDAVAGSQNDGLWNGGRAVVSDGSLAVITAPSIGSDSIRPLVTFASLVPQHDRGPLLIAGGWRASHCSARSRVGESGPEWTRSPVPRHGES